MTRSNRLHNQLRPHGEGQYLVINDDEITLSLQGSSQWDSFAHFGAFGRGLDGVYLGGAGLDETYPQTFAPTLGVHALGPAIVTRGVLVDVVAEVDPAAGYLAQDMPIGRDLIEAALRNQSIEIEPGDAVLVYTGFERLRDALDGVYPTDCAGLDGSTVQLWDERDIIALISDNMAVEKLPADYVIHIEMLRTRGVPLGELWALESLAMACRHDHRYDFLLASVPLNIPGAFGSTANAVAVR